MTGGMSDNSNQTLRMEPKMPNGTDPTNHFTTLQAAEQITRSNVHWGSTLGNALTITYAFRQGIPENYVSSTKHNEKATFAEIAPQQKISVQLAMALWSDVARITFAQKFEPNPDIFPPKADIQIATYLSTTDESGGFAGFPDTANSGDVWLNRNSISATSTVIPGDFAFKIIMHELAHALGLEHPGDYNAAPGVKIEYKNDALYVEDTNTYTIMTYFDFQQLWRKSNHAHRQRYLWFQLQHWRRISKNL
jgi:serralysin